MDYHPIRTKGRKKVSDKKKKEKENRYAIYSFVFSAVL